MKSWIDHWKSFQSTEGIFGELSDLAFEKAEVLFESKNPVFDYVPIKKYFEKSLQWKDHQTSEASIPVLEESKDSYLVFEDGMFRKELSHVPSKIQVMELKDALEGSYRAPLLERIRKMIKEELDPFALLNIAFINGGAFIYVPPKMKLSTPLQIIHLQTKKTQQFEAARIHIYFGAESKVSIVSSLEKVDYLYHDALDLTLEDHAEVSQTIFSGMPRLIWGGHSLRASLKKSSKLKTSLINFGGTCFRFDAKIVLKGERAEVDLSGLNLVSNQFESHTHIHVDHVAESALSSQSFKNVLLDQSRASFSGKIYVEKEAQKTEAYQLCESLVLSDKAFIYAKPALEILADDVKASHGATIAALNEDQLLYLQTRGIDLVESKRILTLGFIQEKIEAIEVETLKFLIQKQIVTIL